MQFIHYVRPTVEKLEDVQFTMIWKRRKQNVLTFENLEPTNIWVFSLINDLNNYSIIKIVES